MLRRILCTIGLATIAACAVNGADSEDDSEDAHASGAESALTNGEKKAICAAIPAARPWSDAEKVKLRDEVVRRFVETKRKNDALIASRGVGSFAGVKSEVMKAIDRGDRAAAIAAVKPKLKPGNDAARVVDEIAGTSCIGRVYAVLAAVYADLGRADEWRAIEKCGRAWDSDGLHVQQALIANGWQSPALGLVNDEAHLPGSAAEVAVHQEFLRAAGRGSYFDTPVSKTVLLKNFLPSPGSNTQKDDSMLRQIGQSQFLGMATLRGAYHVPFVVPAASIPDDFARPGTSQRAARDRGEPFILESHSLRAPWDPTNFEIRPLTEAMSETFGASVTYATGTILFSPGSANPIGSVAPVGGCMSSVLGRQVPENACVQRPADGLWFRCDHGGWASSSTSDAACGEKYPR